jgi:uncharacterized protein YbaP (TraB family)
MYFEIPGTSARVLGSIHASPRGAETTPSWALAAVDWADDFVLEGNGAGLLELALAAEPTHLQSKLDAETWQRLIQIWPLDGGLPPIESLEPWAVLLIAYGQCQEAGPGIEALILREAQRTGRPVHYLEETIAMVRSFNATPRADAIAGIRDLCRDLRAPQRVLNTWQAAWLRSDIDAIDSAAREFPFFAYPALRRAAMSGRHANWVESFREYCAPRKRTLFVVGALHLHGEDGLFRYLEVQPVLLAGDG